MDRYYTKKHYVNKRAQKKSRMRWLFLVFFLLAVVATFALLRSTTLAPYYASISQWATAKHTQLTTPNTAKDDKKSTVANNADEAEKIHFEFYTALPKMQIKAPKTNSPTSPTSPASPAGPKVEVANADELERQLSEAVNEK